MQNKNKKYIINTVYICLIKNFLKMKTKEQKITKLEGEIEKIKEQIAEKEKKIKKKLSEIENLSQPPLF